MAAPLDQLSQRELAIALRAAIDLCGARETESRLARVRELVEGNPRAFRSRHVLYNLGRKRRTWLVVHGLLPVRPDATEPVTIPQHRSNERLLAELSDRLAARRVAQAEQARKARSDGKIAHTSALGSRLPPVKQ